MTIVITGLGIAVPSHKISQAEAFEATQQLCCDSEEHKRVMGLIYEGAGVQERGAVLLEETNGILNREENFFWQRSDEDDRGPTTRARMEKYEQYSVELGIRSCQMALDRANQDVSEITHLVTVSCSGFCSPGVDVALIKELGLSPETARTHIGFMGCHGSFNALRVAKAFIDADPSAVVLICSVELCSLHHHYGWSTEKVTANALFGDGSASVICRAARVGENWAGPELQLRRSGSYLLAGTTKAMGWQIGDYGFEMTLSRRVPSLIKKNLGPWMQQFLAKSEMTVDDVSSWAIHGLGPCILDAFVTALSLQTEQVATSRAIISEHGNMSSATILFLLERVMRDACPGPVVALGCGPGLTFEAMILNATI